MLSTFDSLVGPELEAGMTNREAGRRWLSPDCSGLFAVEAVVWLLEPVLVPILFSDTVWPSSISIFSLPGPLLVIFSLLISWPTQRMLETQNFTSWGLSSCFHSQVYWEISLTFCCIITVIIWQECDWGDAFQTLERMQWTNIMTTMTETRTIHIPCKVLQNQELQLLKPGQENKSHRLQGSILESQVA